MLTWLGHALAIRGSSSAWFVGSVYLDSLIFASLTTTSDHDCPDLASSHALTLAMSSVRNLIKLLLEWLVLFCMPVKHRHEVQTGEYLIGLAILIIVITVTKLFAIYLMRGWAHVRSIRFVCQLSDCLFWWTLRETLDYKVFTFPDVIPIIGLALNYCLIRMMVTAELDVAPESVHAPEATPEPPENAQEAPSGEDLLQSRLASLHRPHKVADVSAPLLTFSSRIDANRPQSPPKTSSLQRLSSHDFKTATREFMHLVRPVIYILLFCSYVRLHHSPVALDNAYQCINNIQDDTLRQTLSSAKSCLVPLFSKECPEIDKEICEEMCEEMLEDRDRPHPGKGACRIEMTGKFPASPPSSAVPLPSC